MLPVQPRGQDSRALVLALSMDFADGSPSLTCYSLSLSLLESMKGEVVVLESDSSVLVNLVKSVDRHPWEVGVLFMDACRVSGQNKHLSLPHCSRDSNGGAD